MVSGTCHLALDAAIAVGPMLSHCRCRLGRCCLQPHCCGCPRCHPGPPTLVGSTTPRPPETHGCHHLPCPPLLLRHHVVHQQHKLRGRQMGKPTGHRVCRQKLHPAWAGAAAAAEALDGVKASCIQTEKGGGGQREGPQGLTWNMMEAKRKVGANRPIMEADLAAGCGNWARLTPQLQAGQAGGARQARGQGLGNAQTLEGWQWKQAACMGSTAAWRRKAAGQLGVLSHA